MISRGQLLKAILLFVIGVCLPAASRAGLDTGFATQDGGQPGAFLDYAADARSIGMGQAQTAVTNDAGALYWNPAALKALRRDQLIAFYSDLYEDTNFGFVGYARPTHEQGTFAAGLVSLRSDNFVRRDAGGARTGQFDSIQNAFLLSHGRALGTKWDVGATLKFVTQEFAGESAAGYGADAAFKRRFGKRFDTALMVRNLVAPRIKLRNRSERFPTDVRLGAGIRLFPSLLMAADLEQSSRRNLKIYLGWEWNWQDRFFFRTGFNEQGPNAGAGLKFGDFGIDYAFGYHQAAGGIDDLGLSHKIGFKLSFGVNRTEEAASLKWRKQSGILLAKLAETANRIDDPSLSPTETDRLIDQAREAIRRKGFAEPAQLFAAQGYTQYLSGDYEKSVQSFAEAEALGAHSLPLDRARIKLSEEKTKSMISKGLEEAKNFYLAGRYAESVNACERVLSLEVQNAEAKVYLEDAKKQLKEPIERELRIAAMDYEHRNYFAVIRRLQAVKNLDPENVEAERYFAESLRALEEEAANEADAAARRAAGSASGPGTAPNADLSRQLYQQGLLLYSEGRLEEAQQRWEKALQAAPHNTLARNALTRVKSERKN